jgi:hypothetical protein
MCIITNNAGSINSFSVAVRHVGERNLRKYRTIKVVSWRVNFSSGADADFAGLLAVNQESCIR